MRTKLLITTISLILTTPLFASQDSNLACPAKVTCSQQIFPDGSSRTTCDNDSKLWSMTPRAPYNNYDNLTFQLISVLWVRDHPIITNACEYQNSVYKIELERDNRGTSPAWYPQDSALWNIKQDPTDPWKWTGECIANNPCYMATTPSHM